MVIGETTWLAGEGCALRLVETFWLVETFGFRVFKLQLKVINKNVYYLYSV